MALVAAILFFPDGGFRGSADGKAAILEATHDFVSDEELVAPASRG